MKSEPYPANLLRYFLLFIFFACLRPSASAQIDSLEAIANWTKSGTTYKYALEMKLLHNKQTNEVGGVFRWTYITPNKRSSKSVRASKNKLRKKAITFVRGTYNPDKKEYTVSSKTDFDPYNIISTGTAKFKVKRGKIKGSTSGSRRTSGQSGGKIKGELTSFPSLKEFLQEAGLDLEGFQVVRHEVGDASLDGQLSYGESGYSAYSIQYNNKDKVELPKGLIIYPKFEGANVKTAGIPYHTYYKEIEPNKEYPLYLLPFQRDSTQSEQKELKVHLNVSFYGAFAIPVSTQTIKLDNDYPVFTDCGDYPPIPMEHLHGLYIDGMEDRVLNLRKDNTFIMHLANSKKVFGKWRLKKYIDDGFEDKKSVPAKVKTFTTFTFYDYQPYDGSGSIDLFEDEGPFYSPLRTFDFAEEGIIELGGKRGRYGRDYHPFLKAGNLSKDDPQLKKLLPMVTGKWYQPLKSSVNYYHLRADGTVLFGNSGRSGTDIGKWIISNNTSLDGKEGYTLLLYQFQQQVMSPIIFLINDQASNQEKLKLSAHLQDDFTDEQFKIYRYEFIKDDDIQFEDTPMKKKEIYNPFSDFLWDTINSSSPTGGKDCSRCGGAGSTRSDAGSCWACHGTGKE